MVDIQKAAGDAGEYLKVSPDFFFALCRLYEYLIVSAFHLYIPFDNEFDEATSCHFVSHLIVLLFLGSSTRAFVAILKI